MSQTSVPKFLLGGIRMSRNFLGSKVMTTAAYGMVETGVKVAPLFLLVAYAAGPTRRAPTTFISEGEEFPSTERRASFE